MTQLAKYTEQLMGRNVTVDVRGSRESYVGCLTSIDVEPLQHGVGPTVVMADDEGNVTVVFDVAAISTEEVEEEDEGEDEDEEDEEEEEDEEDDED